MSEVFNGYIPPIDVKIERAIKAANMIKEIRTPQPQQFTEGYIVIFDDQENLRHYEPAARFLKKILFDVLKNEVHFVKLTADLSAFFTDYKVPKECKAAFIFSSEYSATINQSQNKIDELYLKEMIFDDEYGIPFMINDISPLIALFPEYNN